MIAKNFGPGQPAQDDLRQCYRRPLLQAWLFPDLNTIPNNFVKERILFSSVVMVLAFGARDHWFESCPNLIFLPCIYSFLSLLRTLFVRTGILNIFRVRA